MEEMLEFKPFLFRLSPKFGKMTEDQPSDLFFFDWAILFDPDEPVDLTKSVSRNRLLLFQMFVTQYCLQLLHNQTGMSEDFNNAKPKQIITKKQQQAIEKGLFKLYYDIYKRYATGEPILIKKPKTFNLHENENLDAGTDNVPDLDL